MTTITLPYDFEFRSYQKEPWNAIMHPEFKRGILVVPRRNGKDLLSWNALIAKAMERVALYYYIAPYYNQVRQIIWEGFTGSGRRFIDYIPNELVVRKTKLDMRVDLSNGSQIKLQGSDQIDRIVGTNPYGIVFTEFSLHKPQAWEYLRPILAENGGWAVFNGTPRGLNHFYETYQLANNNPAWYTQFLTRDDTGIPTLDAIEEDRQAGMPEELIQQEYYCSFMSGVVGSYYAMYINKAREDGRIGNVPYDPMLPTYTFWDIGIDDLTAIWVVQIHRAEIRLIDYVENHRVSMLDNFKILEELPYSYEEHFGPWDLAVKDVVTGNSRLDRLAERGKFMTTVDRTSKENGREACKAIFSRCFWDAKKCERGILALMHYQQKYDEKKEKYSDTEHGNWAVHGADAFKHLALTADILDRGVTLHPVKHRVIRAVGGKHGVWRTQKALRYAQSRPL